MDFITFKKTDFAFYVLVYLSFENILLNTDFTTVSSPKSFENSHLAIFCKCLRVDTIECSIQISSEICVHVHIHVSWLLKVLNQK